MDLSTRVLGSHIAKQLQEKIATPILNIGQDRFTRQELSRVACFNFTAALNIDRICRELKVKDTRDLFNRIAPSAFAVPKVGAISIAVLGSVFQAKRIGGEHPLENWIARHSEHGIDDLRSFVTIKAQSLTLSESKK